MRRLTLLLLTALLTLISVSAAADVHASHQQQAPVHDQHDTDAAGLDLATEPQADCGHCCHCHGGSLLLQIAPALEFHPSSIALTLTDRREHWPSTLPVSLYRPPIS